MTEPRKRADEPALPSAASAGVDARVIDVWCEWLGALATDAEAALAAAMAYKELDDAARDRWLSALEQDAPRLAAVESPTRSGPPRRKRRRVKRRAPCAA